MEDALAEMKRRGAVLVDPADIPHAGEYDDSELEVLLYELKADLDRLPRRARAEARRCKTLADVIAFNEAHRAEEMPYFGQELFLRAQEKGPLTTPAYLEALEKNRRLSRAEGHRRGDGRAPPRRAGRADGRAGLDDRPRQRRPLHRRQLDAAPAVAGYPNITVPAGYVFGLPVGHLVLRPRLERARPAQAGLRVRAGDAAPPPPALPADGGLVQGLRAADRSPSQISGEGRGDPLSHKLMLFPHRERH